MIKKALELNTAALILAHCPQSPIGQCVRPSETGQSLTQTLAEALSLVEIRVLDHFTLGDGAGYSFAEHRLL